MRLCRGLAMVIAAMAIVGCSDDSMSSTESTAAAADSTITEPALPEPITAQGAARVELADRIEQKLEIPDNPDWMVSAFGSLWVKRDNGDVMRVDPATGKVQAAIGAGKFEEPLCQGLGASDDAIWACPPLGEPGGTVVRIDPDRNEVVSTLKARKMPDQGRIVSAAERLWLLGEGGQSVVAVDLESEKQVAEIRLGETCTDVAASGTTVWVVCPIDGHVLRIDAETGEIEGEGDFSGARTASVGNDLWVGFDGGVAQADPETLEISAVYDVHPELAGAVYASGDEVWVREEGRNFLTRIDGGGGRITEVIEAPPATSGGDAIVIGDSVWASAGNDDAVYELSR